MDRVGLEPTTAAGSLLREVYFLSKWTAAMEKEDSPLKSPLHSCCKLYCVGRAIEED
jgi:hypothetical protein